MADVAVHIAAPDPFHSSKPALNGHHLPELQNGELLTERKKRRAAEKEASRWRKKAVELQAQWEELEQHQEQKRQQIQQQAHERQQQGSEQACSQSKADAAGEKGTDEEHVALLVSLIMTRAVAQAEAEAQVAEEESQAKLLSERAAREARMEDAIVRARIRLEHEEQTSWSRRVEQAALAAGFVGLGALGAYLTICMVQSSNSAPSDHNWHTGTDTASLTQAAMASSSAPVDVILGRVPSQEVYQLGSLISTADVLQQRATAQAAAVVVPIVSAAVSPAAAAFPAAALAAVVQQSGTAQQGVVHTAADRLAQHVGQQMDSMAAGASFGFVAASSVREGAAHAGRLAQRVG